MAESIDTRLARAERQLVDVRRMILDAGSVQRKANAGGAGGGSARAIGKLDTNLAATGTADVVVWSYSATGGDEVATDNVLTGVRGWAIPSGQQLLAGCQVVVFKINGQLYAF